MSKPQPEWEITTYDGGSLNIRVVHVATGKVREVRNATQRAKTTYGMQQEILAEIESERRRIPNPHAGFPSINPN